MGDHDRPLLTLWMRHYNQAPFVEAALKGAFAQTYSPLEIVFLDDASSDNGYGIAQELAAAYRGPHRVVLWRNERNLGPGAQADRMLELSRGDIIVTADADDVSLPERCQHIYEAFHDGGPELLGVDSFFDLIDADGRPLVDVPERLARNRLDRGGSTPEMLARGLGGLQGAAAAYRRSVFERGVPLAGLRQDEDLELAFRSRVLGRTATIPESLLLYRVHAANYGGRISAEWTGRELHAWFSRHWYHKIVTASFMRRDVNTFERAGLVAPDRARQLRRELKLYARELKLLRVAPRLAPWRRWTIYLALRQLGLHRYPALRLMMIAVAPSLAMMFLRRNPINQAR